MLQVCCDDGQQMLMGRHVPAAQPCDAWQPSAKTESTVFSLNLGSFLI